MSSSERFQESNFIVPQEVIGEARVGNLFIHYTVCKQKRNTFGKVPEMCSPGAWILDCSSACLIDFIKPADLALETHSGMAVQVLLKSLATTFLLCLVKFLLGLRQR